MKIKEIVPGYGLGSKNQEKRFRWSAISLQWPPYDLITRDTVIYHISFFVFFKIITGI